MTDSRTPTTSRTPPRSTLPRPTSDPPLAARRPPGDKAAAWAGGPTQLAWRPSPAAYAGVDQQSVKASAPHGRLQERCGGWGKENERGMVRCRRVRRWRFIRRGNTCRTTCASQRQYSLCFDRASLCRDFQNGSYCQLSALNLQ